MGNSALIMTKDGFENGGIGLYLQQTLQVFDYAKTGMIILVIIVVVVIIDYISTKSREALMK